VKTNDRAILGGAKIALRRYTMAPRPLERFKRVFRKCIAGPAMGLDVKRS
jgi:hypothetical protein